ncbi:MAG: hypothetical protein RLZ00_1506, partial [Pseudomonadota bacterium]
QCKESQQAAASWQNQAGEDGFEGEQ